MNQDDDDPNWDPRIRWAKTNFDDISHLVLERTAYDEGMALLSFMEKKSTTLPEIAKNFAWTHGKIQGRMQWLRRRGVTFRSQKMKHLPMVYEVKCRPLHIAFQHPKTTERYH